MGRVGQHRLDGHTDGFHILLIVQTDGVATAQVEWGEGAIGLNDSAFTLLLLPLFNPPPSRCQWYCKQKAGFSPGADGPTCDGRKRGEGGGGGGKEGQRGRKSRESTGQKPFCTVFAEDKSHGRRYLLRFRRRGLAELWLFEGTASCPDRG